MQPLTRLSMRAVTSAACSEAGVAGDVAMQDLNPVIPGLAAKLGGEAGVSGAVLQQKILDEIKSPVDAARRWFCQRHLGSHQRRLGAD